jgi:hypothetical protein
MMEARRRLGWEDPLARPTLRWTAAGFDVIGGPMTPRRHWERMAAEIPEDRRQALKRLKPVG